MTNIHTLASLFEERGYEWSFRDNKRVPTQAEVDGAILEAIDKIKDSDNLTQIEFGRMIIQKDGPRYNLYVFIGEVGQ